MHREAGARGARVVKGTCCTTAWATQLSMTTKPASPGV